MYAIDAVIKRGFDAGVLVGSDWYVVNSAEDGEVQY